MIIYFKNMKLFYNSLGSLTKASIKLFLISIISTLILAVFCYLSNFSDKHYELLLISDQLLLLAEDLIAMGVIFSFIFNFLEQKVK